MEGWSHTYALSTVLLVDGLSGAGASDAPLRPRPPNSARGGARPSVAALSPSRAGGRSAMAMRRSNAGSAAGSPRAPTSLKVPALRSAVVRGAVVRERGCCARGCRARAGLLCAGLSCVGQCCAAVTMVLV